MQNPKLAQILLATVAVLACAAPAPALAQSAVTPTYVGMTPQDVGVMDRAKPEYDAKGVPLGGFRLFPSLDASASYDTNVFRQPSNEVSDWFFTISPALRLDSQWGRHFLEFYAGADIYEYSKQTNENLADWAAGGKFRLDISHASTLAGWGYYSEKHEAWWAPSVVNYQSKPNRYYQGHGDLEWRYQPDRLGIEFGGSADRFDWLNTPTIGSSTMIDNKDRNETEYQGYAKAFYDFSPGYSAFVRGMYDERDYDEELDRASLHRASHGFRVQGGLDLQVSHLVHGEIFAGYLKQAFKAPLNDVSGFDYGAKLDWYASPVFTIHLTGSRELQDVVLNNVSVADNKTVALGADYEFRPNVILQAQGSYTDSRYIGSGLSDRYPGILVGIRYLISRYVSADLNYNYSARSTDRTNVKYTDSLVSFGLNFHI